MVKKKDASNVQVPSSKKQTPVDLKIKTSENMDREISADQLPRSIGELFELNNYTVSYGVQINGAEIDIVAKSKSNPFSPDIYIEATIQYVDNTKYGKDSTKFLLVKSISPQSTCILVSSSGFTAEVKERAEKSNIITLTYSEIFGRFEKFGDYVSFVTNDKNIVNLVGSYEEPLFSDSVGNHYATSWLDQWKKEKDPQTKWLIILGEYGTGKTSLTQVLQHRWLVEYKNNPSSSIPIRIELKNFSRQFDAHSLLHHFLDTNGLGHIPIDFMIHLIRRGRIFLILDGYDEMAQFLNARERRACLGALANLSSDGARGILTSRPNYFTETEELNVFDALYTSLEQNKYHLGEIDRLYVAEEKSIDDLVHNYVLNRRERYLRDLTAAQTESLVKRKLMNDQIGQDLVLGLLKKIFREEAEGGRQSLSGKPVIISYLLELIDDLRDDSGGQINPEHLTEWQVYKLVVDRLMFRDLQRSPALDPDHRRIALQNLAISLSKKESPIATDQTFFSIIDDVFRGDLRRRNPEDRRMRREELFQDLRSSSTLTRSEGGGAAGWFFSHNSLREYLVAEFLVSSAISKATVVFESPVSSAMRSFVASLHEDGREKFLNAMQELWLQSNRRTLGPYLSLSWDLLRRLPKGLIGGLKMIVGDADTLAIDGAAFENGEFNAIEIGVEKIRISAEETTFSNFIFKSLDFSGSNFNNVTLDNVYVYKCKFDNCSFRNSLIFECDFSEVDFKSADFRGLDLDSNFLVKNRADGSLVALSGRSALGWLKFRGAYTDDIDPYFVYQHHSKFPIIIKICEHLIEQKQSQLLGLTQRGAAQVDPPFARAFLEHLKKRGLVEINRHKLVSVTPEGRSQIPPLINHQKISDDIIDFIVNYG